MGVKVFNIVDEIANIEEGMKVALENLVGCTPSGGLPLLPTCNATARNKLLAVLSSIKLNSSLVTTHIYHHIRILIDSQQLWLALKYCYIAQIERQRERGI